MRIYRRLLPYNLDMILKLALLVLCTLYRAFANNDLNLRECKNSKIERDVTLKGGIGAGTFRKLGKVTAMASCIELCCKTPTCDVAFLSSSKCYGVECVSDEECESTATDTSDRRVLIAHVRTGHKKENTSLALERATQHPVIGAEAKSRLLAEQQKSGLNQATNPQAAGPVVSTANGKISGNTGPMLNANANALGLNGKINANTNPLPNGNVNAFGSNPNTNTAPNTNTILPNANAVQTPSASIMPNAAAAKAAIPQQQNGANPSMAGQCKAGKTYTEVTLKGGINAGTYKDVGEVASTEECSKRCCDYSACDVAFMLQKRCYLVGCSEGKSCKFQKAKPSAYHPSLTYVTRWNGEGVKHSLFIEDEESKKSVCNPMKVLTKVTLKGGLKAGDFTDTGKAGNIAECYDICCKQSTCDLAFMLGQNCFSVKCYNKDLCSTIHAQPSIYNPQIAYVVSRKAIEANPVLGTQKDQVSKPNPDCPKGEILDKVTLVGGINAGSFRDHGKIKDMNLCRRICCEMTKCNLAFMLGGSCFSVECKTENACKTQPANPSQLFPQVSYVRNFGSTSLIGADTTKDAANQRNQVPTQAAASSLESLVPPPAANPQIAQYAHPPDHPIQSQLSPFEQTLSAKVPSVTSMADVMGMKEPFNDGNIVVGSQTQPGQPSQAAQPVQPAQPAAQPGEPAVPAQPVLPNAQTTKPQASVEKPQADKEKEATKTNSKPDVKEQIKAAGAGQAMTMSLVNGQLQLTPVGSESGDGSGADAKGHGAESAGAFDAILGGAHSKDGCEKVKVVSDVTLKGGKKAGTFKDHGDVTSMDTCQELCCKQKDCNVAFMLGKTCYSVTCKSKESCDHTTAPPSNFNPRLAYVRPVKEAHKDSEKAPPPPKEPKDLACKHSNITNDKKLPGSIHKKNYTLTKDVDNMADCMRKCCDSKKCDVAYFVEKKCYQVSCSSKDACRPLSVKASKDSPLMSAMTKRPEPEKPTELEVQPNPAQKSTGQETTGFSLSGSSCQSSKISTGVTLRGGKNAGNFTDLGLVNNLDACIDKCCRLPLCDIAYMENKKCFSVRCFDGILCQTTSGNGQSKDVQLAYMNRNGSVAKERDWMIIYIIVGSLAFVAVIGGAIWAACICARRQKVGGQHRRLLEEEDEDDVMLPKPTQPRYRAPMTRY